MQVWRELIRYLVSKIVVAYVSAKFWNHHIKINKRREKILTHSKMHWEELIQKEGKVQHGIEEQWSYRFTTDIKLVSWYPIDPVSPRPDNSLMGKNNRKYVTNQQHLWCLGHHWHGNKQKNWKLHLCDPWAFACNALPRLVTWIATIWAPFGKLRWWIEIAEHDPKGRSWTPTMSYVQWLYPFHF